MKTQRKSIRVSSVSNATLFAICWLLSVSCSPQSALGFAVRFSGINVEMNKSSNCDAEAVYRVTLAGVTVSKSFLGCCAWSSDTPLGTADIEPNAAYTCEVILADGTSFCDTSVQIESLPPCYVPYINGVSNQSVWVDHSSGGTYRTFTFELRGATNMTNVATWSIRDGNGKLILPNPVNNAYQMPADGESTATPYTLDPDAYFTFEFIGDSLGCTMGSGAVITAGETPGTIRVRAHRGTPVCEVQEFLMELTECNQCQSGDCGGFGAASGVNGSIDFKLGLGWSANTGQAGFLHVKYTAPMPDLKSLSRVLYNFQRRDAEVVRHPDGALLQVKVPEGVANIVTNTTYKYTIELYTAANIVG